MAKKKGMELDTKLTAEWDPESKEPWLLEFENQPVNDERWSCLVTSAIPAKIEDDECIQNYKRSVASGWRRGIKILSMGDMINLLKGSGSPAGSKKGDKKAKGEKPDKTQKKEEKPPSPRFNQITNLVLKYATFNDYECKLPPGLMAVMLKYMILKLKEDNIRENKILAVRQRKIRERNLKAKFIKDLKPFKTKGGTGKEGRGGERSDQPFTGPDLYILMTDFFDIFYYPELIRIKVPFVAFVKIVYAHNEINCEKIDSAAADKTDNTNKGTAIQDFWKNLRDTCSTSDKTWQFKDIAFVKYGPTSFSRNPSQKENNNKIIYDEMSWIQYAAYRIYCQHQKYIQQLYVQNVTLSLERLDLSKCEVYNKLCDVLITGQPLTPLFVLYAMIEQLVVGVPETESTEAEFDININNFFPSWAESVTEESSFPKNSTVNLVTPCLQCRGKVNDYVNVCDISTDGSQSTEKSERSSCSEDKTAKESNDRGSIPSTKSESDHSNKSEYSGESSNLMELIDQVLSERKTEKAVRKEKNWKPPRLCFHGDSVTLHTYHCDPRIINPEELVQRFMKNADLMRIWTKYPELSPGERAFYNFHFNNFVKISQEKEESLKIKIIFALLMKTAGTSKFYLFKGEDRNVSHDVSMIWRSNQKNSADIKFYTTLLERFDNQYCFSNFFFGNFVLDLYNHPQRKTVFQIHNLKILEASEISTTRNDSNMYLAGNRSSVTYNPHNFMNLENLPQPHNTLDHINDVFLPILDCFDISTLSDFNFINQFEAFHAMVEGFNFYEKLRPALMIQRLLECREEYNTIHCTYFPPTDNVAILMHNDSDHRGIFFRINSGSLPTPIALRDFYCYVYPEISQWVVEEIDENVKFVSGILEKERAKEEKKDEEYLAQLKLSYCRLSEEGRKEFLQEEIDLASEPEVTENELRELPYKIGVHSSSKERSFVVTDFGNLRVETCQKVHEFHSKDGTEVLVVFEGWLYETSEALILTIRRSSLWFRHYLFLRGEDQNFDFTLKTASDIIFSFFKESETSSDEPAPFNVRISWPTGLLIEVKSVSNSPDSNRYIKQSYIKTYRKGWEVEEEKLRCYLKNGEIIIVKETGDVKVLTGNGTIHNIFYGEVPLYETITMTGEVWEQLVVKTKCRKRRKISTLKVYLGVDCKTRETYYKRDDGTTCMLWPNGKLVTNYPDGTKITSIPDFEEEGVTVEWDEEEKQQFLELESKLGDSRSKSRTSMRGRGVSQRCIQSEEFVSVSCTYLMEHPKYSTVYSDAGSSLMEIRMQENMSIKTVSEGCFEVQKNNNYLCINKNVVQFDTRCDGCGKSSNAVIDFDSNILCHFIDLFENEFVVHKDGETLFHENIVLSGDLMEDGSIQEKKNDHSFCLKRNAVDIALKQKCFLLERDLSGIEFIHEENVANYCYDLPDDSYFDLNTDDPNAISHTFSSSLSKIGYENWMMHYEKDDSLPTNLKKKDLKDIEVRENPNKLFKYPFPQSHDVVKCENNNHLRVKVNMPKVKLVRILKCFPYPGSKKVISDICKYAREFERRALDICNKYDRCKVGDYESADYVKMRLKKIAITLSQTLTLYPHLCTQLPSTEKDVHYFGHLVNRMEDMRSHFNGNDLLPKCKQIPRCLPRITDFPTIREESEQRDG